MLVLDTPLAAMPIESRLIDPTTSIVASAFHTVADIYSDQTYTRGNDAQGVYADFNAQYAARPRGQFNFTHLLQTTFAFQLYASGDGIALENDAGLNLTAGVQFYQEASSGKFYAAIAAPGGTVGAITFPCPSINTWHTYVTLIDRTLAGSASIVATWVDTVPQVQTNFTNTYVAGSTIGASFFYTTMNFMARNAGASLKLTGRLRNFHVAAGHWNYDQMLAFHRNPYSVFVPDRAFYPQVVAAGGSAAQSRYYLAA